MKKLCKHFSGEGNFKHPVTSCTKGTFLSLMLIACTTFTACNNEESLPTAGNQLELSFGINAPESRAIFTDTKLPDNSPVGVKLDGYADYANLVYTGSTTSGTQSWTSTTDVTLTETKGTLYAYWPQNSSVAIDAIDVDMTATDQTDWLYATPVTDVNEDKASVAVTMNHALANINVTVNKGTYKGDGNITNITVQSDGIALGGTFNAAKTIPAYEAFEDEGKPLSRTVTTTAGTAATDIMVVPTGTSAAITFLLTIDDIQFTAKSDAVQLAMGNSYQYTLNLSDISTYMEISGFSVKPWTSTTGGTLDLEEVKGNSGPAIDATGKANGVYVVTATGQLVDKSAATPDCIGVAFISANQKVMIAKAEATDGTNSTLYWGKNLFPQDVPNLENLEDVTAAKADYNGKANTAAIIAGYAALGKDMDSRDMCKVLETYNEGGYTDWYVPAAGQLDEFYSNKAAINEALTAISGKAFNSNNRYMSSSEESASSAWSVHLANASVNSSYKNTALTVRFVRDIN